MNARMFDPQLGRFLQVDPVVQAPENAQSWNAYTYVFNNPYAYTDPTGMIGVKERQWLAVIVGVVAAVFGQYYLAQQMYAAAFLVTVAGGAAAAGIATQSWSGAAKGAFTAALTFGIGYGVASDVAQIAAQAVTGGVMEWLQGGQFGSGFLSAGLTAIPRVTRPGAHPAPPVTAGAARGGRGGLPSRCPVPRTGGGG
nr:RHS repeat-associated core domain-containing protein [Lysobacter pythonis]